MRGLRITDGKLEYRTDLPRPEAVAGESRIRIVRAGVCATDLALVRGYMGFTGIPGHEFVGVAVDGPHAGRRVVGEINAACGHCSWCRADLGRHCPHRSVLGILGRDGCFAEEIRLPHENLLPVPDTVTSDAAVFTEPLAAAYEMDEQLDLCAIDTALVVGDGRLGLLCAHVLARRGLDVTVAGRHPERDTLLGDRVVHTTDLVTPSATPERQFDLAVEATGRPEVLEQVIPFVRPRGTLVLKTTSEAPAPLDLAPLVINEITLVGSRCGRFRPALDALAAGEPGVERMIEARYPVMDGCEALEHAGRKGVLKVLIDVAEE